MELFSDWNCHVMPSMRDRISDEKDSVGVLSYMMQELKIRSLCMMPEYDSGRESVSMFLLRRRRSANRLQEAIEAHWNTDELPVPQIKLSAAVYLTRGLYEIKNLSKLNLPLLHGSYLPIRMPIAGYKDWMDYELNRLLFRSKFQLLFTSFELCAIWYPKDILEKLLRIQNAAYQFNYKSLSDAGICDVIGQLIDRKATILLGTGIDCIDRCYSYDLSYYLDCAKSYFSAIDYRFLMKNNQKTYRKTFRKK